MHVTLGQLRAFERIVRLGSFHAAALELKLSQPSVSQRIRELEAALNTPLFVRRGPRVSLTAEGHALIEYADRMLATAGELVERFRTRDPLKGTLRLEPSKGGTVQVLDAELKAHVPFIGGKIEQAAADPIRTAIGIETGLLREWLAR